MSREGFNPVFATEHALLNTLKDYDPPEVVCDEVLRLHVLYRLTLPSASMSLRDSIKWTHDTMVKEQIRDDPAPSEIKGPTLWEHLNES